MSTHYVNRKNDEEIIDIVHSVLDNGTGKAEIELIDMRFKVQRGTSLILNAIIE